MVKEKSKIEELNEFIENSKERDQTLFNDILSLKFKENA